MIEIQWNVILCARPVAFTDVTPRSDAFNHPALQCLNLSLVFNFSLCCSPHGMDLSDHDSDRTADDEHDVQPSDLEELTAVAFLSWSSGKLDLLELYSIHGMK